MPLAKRTFIEVLREAGERVSVLQVASDLGIELRLGANKSPFREDRKASFAILHDGHSYKDYATGDAGGCWKFVKLCKPEWENKEINAYIIRLAGMEGELDNLAKPSKAKLAEERRAKRRAAFDRINKAYTIRPIEDSLPIPEKLQARYDEGCDYMMGQSDLVTKLAASRGWPTYWVDELVEVGKIACPVEPWRGGKRMVAFLVERPAYKKGSVVPGLQAVGFHQKFYDIDTGEKSWRFWPSKKMNGGCRPYPFVLGDLADPSVVIVHEGQWDAITWWGAAGYFDHAPLGDGICCFGLRGAKSIEVFISKYGPWLELHRPSVWLINDNDTAGEGFHKTGIKDGVPVPSLTDHLHHLGIEKVVNSQFSHVKDFNDAYKAAPQSFGPEQIYELMTHEGLLP